MTFSLTGIDGAVEYAVASASQGVGRNLRFSNAYCVGLAESDQDYRRALESPGDNFADGLPVAWVLRKMNAGDGPLDAFRVRGPSFFEKMIEAGCDHGLRHSFVGATNPTLDRLVAWVSQAHPTAVVAGVYAPPFSPVNKDFLSDIERRIIEQDPQVIWLGLGTPKQDLTAVYLAEKFPNMVIASVGAAFDFKAGVAREAPVWIQKSGFEWLFRLLTEPRRLWHRYSVGSLKFVQAISHQYTASRRSGRRKVKL